MKFLFDYIENSVSYFHTVEQTKKILLRSGFTELYETKKFNLKPKGKYFVVRDDAALIAFVMPSQKQIEKLHLALSHGDSPTYRIKPNGEFWEENMLLWGLETYGGPIYSTWFNRNLSAAGRIFYEQNKQIKSALVNLDSVKMMLTQLPIHIDRKVNSEGFKVSAQEQLNALVKIEEKKTKKSYLEACLQKKIKFTRLLNHELFVYPTESPQYLGGAKDLFSSPRIDNLASASASLEALLKTGKKSHSSNLNMIYLASHEEVGSRTMSGADSTFLAHTLERIFFHNDMSVEQKQMCFAKSMAFSVDGSHALEPKHKDQYEPRHTPILGRGVTVKLDTSACYAYSAAIIAKLKKLEQDRKIKIQVYLKKGDQRQGSTVGPLVTKNLGINTLDIGLAQLSMHASYEVASCRDYEQLVKLLSFIFSDVV